MTTDEPSKLRQRVLDRQLFDAVDHRNKAKAVLLCSQGARADAFFGQTHAFFNAINSSDLELAQILLPHIDPTLADPAGFTPLMIACRFERLDLVELLLPRVDPAQTDVDGDRALTWLLRHNAANPDDDNKPERIKRRLAIFELFAAIDTKLLSIEIVGCPSRFKDELCRALAGAEARDIAQSAIVGASRANPRL